MSNRIHKLTLGLLTAPILMLALAAAAVNADTIYVCWDGSGDYPTIQEGIDAAQDGDEVVVCNGTYTGSGNKDLDFHGKPITVRSENGPDNCTIDCQNAGRGFYFHWGEDADSVVDGFTITRGSVAGGGVYCWGSNPTVKNCTISASTSGTDGGGVYCGNGSDATVSGCTITGNTASYGEGGGVYCHESSPTISNCTITWNTASLHHGGGVYCWDSSATITSCTITGNTATYYGGAVYCVYSNATITNCTIMENTAAGPYGAGGAVGCDQSSPTITNCKITRNTATLWGGGFFFWLSSPTITNCTFAGNSAPAGGAVYCYYNSTPTVINSVLWGDTPEEIYVETGNVSASYCDVQGGWPGCGNIDEHPLFVDPGNGDYHLSAGSPCIDAGCNWGVPPDTADLDGEGRFFDDPATEDSGSGCPPIVDMGAYEFGGTGPQPCPGDLDCDRVVGHSDLGILLADWDCDDPVNGCAGDLNCDCVTDQADLGILLAHWGEVCP